MLSKVLLFFLLDIRRLGMNEVWTGSVDEVLGKKWKAHTQAVDNFMRNSDTKLLVKWNQVSCFLS